MRVELIAIKAAIEVAMSHDIELDADVPEELVDHMAALHSGIDRLENPEKYEGEVEVRSLDEIERDLSGVKPRNLNEAKRDLCAGGFDEATVDGEPEGIDDLALGVP